MITHANTMAVITPYVLVMAAYTLMDALHRIQTEFLGALMVGWKEALDFCKSAQRQVIGGESALPTMPIFHSVTKPEPQRLFSETMAPHTEGTAIVGTITFGTDRF